MNEDSEITKTCESCGASLSPTHTGPCPKCGEKEKKMVLVSNETIIIKESVRCIRKFYKEHPKIRYLVIAINILSPLVGWFFSGLLGLGISLTLMLLASLLGPLVVTKARKTDCGSP